MKNIPVLARAAALVLALAPVAPLVAASAWAAEFLSVSEDVPLMKGLAEDAAAALVFDSPDGRIVEATAAGGETASAVRKFYAETLPQLGWRADGEGRYVRDNEILTIEIAKTGNRRLVRFRFVPAGD
ncbi:MAG: hypothetical protein ACYYKD_00875 [Rhodospirillales bacterium]